MLISSMHNPLTFGTADVGSTSVVQNYSFHSVIDRSLIRVNEDRALGIKDMLLLERPVVNDAIERLYQLKVLAATHGFGHGLLHEDPALTEAQIVKAGVSGEHAHWPSLNKLIVAGVVPSLDAAATFVLAQHQKMREELEQCERLKAAHTDRLNSAIASADHEAVDSLWAQLCKEICDAAINVSGV